MRVVQRAQAVWMKILGILLILVGLTLFATPLITYSRREKVIDAGSTAVTAKREKTLVIPRAIALLIIGAGVMALIVARNPER